MSSTTYHITLTKSDTPQNSVWWSASVEMTPGLCGHAFGARTPEQALAGLAVYLAANRVFGEGDT